MQEERFGTRGLEYSAFHRRRSLQRYVGIEQAGLIAQIDLDAVAWVEYDDRTKVPLLIVETALDVGQAVKPVTVSANLAKLAGLPCYVALYTLDDRPNPAYPACRDIASFRIRRAVPNPEDGWRRLTPKEWGEAILRIRRWKCAQIDGQAASDGSLHERAWQRPPRACGMRAA